MNNKPDNSAKIPVAEFSPPPSGGSSASRFRAVWVLFAVVGLGVAWLIFFFATAVSLRINTDPLDALVDIHGGLHVPLADSYLLRPGEYEVTINAEGYTPIATSVSVNDSREISFALAPLPGSLRLEVIPEDVEALTVEIGSRQIRGENPLVIEDIAPGSYRLRLDADLYAAKDIEIEIQGFGISQSLSTELEPAWADVRLQSSPSEAGIYTSTGQMLGQTPLELRFEEGLVNLRLQKDGYQTRDIELELNRGQQASPDTIRLLPVESSLTLSSQPTGAAVVIDGQYRGETPLQVSLLPEREYQLRLFKAGYSAHESQVRLNQGEDRQINHTLDQVNGRLSVKVSPEDAEIWVDGQPVASGSTELTLSTVTHRIEVRREGYQSQSREFLPLQNQQQSLTFNLLTETEAIWAGIPRRYEFSGHQMLLFRDAGIVRLGSSRREPDRRANEAEWTANLQRAFYVSTHEVTNSQYRRFNQEHSSGNFDRMSLDGSGQPVVGVTWQEAALYCNWLSEQAGLEPFYTTVSGFVSGANPESTGYRLLTEAEWTWLAKVTTSQLERTYPWGNEPDPRPVDNFAGQEVADNLNFTLPIEDSFPVSAPVGSFTPNDKGLYDIGGNVAEYLHDWYAVEPPSSETLVDPLGPEIGEYHVIRGGSWSRGYLPQLRLAYRDYDAVGRNDVGFRIARYAR